MQSEKPHFSLFQHLINLISIHSQSEVRRVRPFYWLLTITFLLMGGLAISNNPQLHSPSRYIPFAGLLLLHIMAHWSAPAFFSKTSRVVIFLVIQAVLVFAISTIGKNLGLTFGLYMAMIGVSIGLLQVSALPSILPLISVLFFLISSVVNFMLLTGASSLASWLPTALPATLFVMVYVFIFQRESKARANAQALLNELEVAHKQLAEYALQIEDLTLGAERQRMARELHDTLAQGLAGLILQLEAADSHLSTARPEKAHAIIQQAMLRARSTLTEARQAIDDLRSDQSVPGALQDLIATEADRLTASTGIECKFDLSLPESLPAGVVKNIDRTIIEALSNIARHAHASKAWVHSCMVGDQIEVEIGDNGVGFTRSTEAGPGGHYGLLGMEERARLAGGKLEVKSTPSEGTVIRLYLPLN
jgi:NarL family two-component system sensor histidine kinase YdfH